MDSYIVETVDDVGDDSSAVEQAVCQVFAAAVVPTPGSTDW